MSLHISYYMIFVVRLGGSVSQTGSSSSSAECVKLQQMIENMRVYQSELEARLQANGQAVPALPAGIEEVASKAAASEHAGVPALAGGEEADMDGESMHGSADNDDEAPEASGDEGTDELDEENEDEDEDAIMDEEKEDNEEPVISRPVAKPDKTKIVEDAHSPTAIPLRKENSQPSSVPIFGPPDTITSSPEPTRVPTRMPATRVPTPMPPPMEEVINSRTHKREYMVLVSSSVIDEFFLVSLQFSILGFTIHCVCTAPLLDKDRLMKSGALATKCPNMTVLAEGTLKAGWQVLAS